MIDSGLACAASSKVRENPAYALSSTRRPVAPWSGWSSPSGASLVPATAGCHRKRKKKPTWQNTQRHSTTSAYLLTSPPDQPGCPLPSRPTTCVYGLTGARVKSV